MLSRFPIWIVLFALFILSISSCRPSVEEQNSLRTVTRDTAPENEPLVTTPSTTFRVHPPDTRVGIDQIDRVLGAVFAGGVEDIIQVVAFTTTACTNADGLGGPPKCREDETEGELVEVFPFSGPEGHYLRAAEIGEWSGLEIAGLFAIYRHSEQVYSEDFFPAGEYSILLSGRLEGRDYKLRIGERGIVRVDNVFLGNLQVELEREAAEVILAPLIP